MEKFFLVVFMSLTLGQNKKIPNTTIIEPIIVDTSIVLDVVPVPILSNGFVNAIAFKESRMIIDTVNKYGMLGKYQFSRATLNGLGYKHISTTTFLKSEALQDEAMLNLLKHNDKILRKHIVKHTGDTINGIVVTHSGILAAAHLAGPSNVKKWLRTKGKKTRTDGFGTSIETYMNKFKNYKINI